MIARKPALLVALGLLLMAAAIGCDDDNKANLFSESEPAAPPPRRGLPPAASASPDGGDDAESKLAFREEDFVETDLSRDPFRSFSKVFKQETASTARTQREVLLERYAVDELRLVGIVTGGAEHRAMFVDPTGTGWIVHRGQFMGKAELVRGSGPGSASYELNWRVDRIRDGDVVLVREDPAHSDIPPATMVIPLRPEDSASASR
ncbi:MAG TPA: pilus assembly protein PilP [Polyangiaceae bacterium]|jgi:type IV pilus assembly protein PilP|nr:MAG: Pilus assembly protein, PilP [Deltaproteobacteria bacterium ADurb.Bin207]HNS98543.1 pilus assembly protein PilP [Polyangiaceae bacterium]HNZ24875.1 pilus assembly protein PilP [Polyangiaceae bacterium]HOD24593.1 pilus assembly protein PilP [Polyangiaceae bacterium]HOE50218.1 pilus assembly protein PilP [Polyangiaceae bacterium]